MRSLSAIDILAIFFFFFDMSGLWHDIKGEDYAAIDIEGRVRKYVWQANRLYMHHCNSLSDYCL